MGFRAMKSLVGHKSQATSGFQVKSRPQNAGPDGRKGEPNAQTPLEDAGRRSSAGGWGGRGEGAGRFGAGCAGCPRTRWSKSPKNVQDILF